jgi:hypothetical protein
MAAAKSAAQLDAEIAEALRHMKGRRSQRPLTARQAEELVERHFSEKFPGAIGRVRRGRKSPRFMVGYVVPEIGRSVTAGTSDVNWESALVNAGVLIGEILED